VTRAQELESRQRSAPPLSLRKAAPSGLPEWKRCEMHRTFFIFDCRLCAGAILSYGH
jgi:hypothetical protein